MKNLLLLLMLSSASLCWGWNCSVPGEVRVQVPASYTGNGVGDGNNQVVSQGGLNFVCETLPTSTPSTGTIANNNTNTNTNGNSNTNTNSANSASNSAANSASNSTSSATNTNNINNTLQQSQKQQQQQNQTATGGASSSTSNATGGTSNATGGTSAATATGNGDGSNNTTTNVDASKIPVATAYAPSALPTVSCFKGFGAGVQTMAIGGSFGGGKIDPNCAILETARSFGIAGSWLAYCKVMITDKYAKKAGITLEDCLERYTPPVAPQPVASPAPAPQPTVVIVPINVPVPTPAPLPTVVTTMDVPLPKVAPKKRVVRHLKPECQNVVTKVCAVTPREK